MKKNILLAILSWAYLLQAQNTVDYIPENVPYLFSFSFSQLNAKSNQMDYGQFLNAFNKRSRYSYDYDNNSSYSCEILEIMDLIKHPDSFGLDLNERFYVYSSNVIGMNGTIYLFKLKNPATFESKLTTECLDKVYIQKRSLSNGTFYISGKISVAINGNIGSVFIKKYNYYDYSEQRTSAFEYYDSAYISEKTNYNRQVDSAFYERLNSGKEYNYENEAQTMRETTDSSIIKRAIERDEQRRLDATLERYKEIQSLMESSVQIQVNNIGKNRNFSKLLSESPDAFVFTNSLVLLNQEMFYPFSSYSSRKKVDYVLSNQSRVLTKDISAYYSINFENGKAIVNFANTYSESVFKYMKKAYGVKQDKSLLKYIDGDNLIGYMSIAINAKEMAKFYEDFYTEMLEFYPKRERDLNTISGIKLFYSLMDKEVLFNTLDGRMILACTGFADIKMKYTTYNYDDDFERTEVTEERFVKQPRMVLAASIGNKENAQKIFNILKSFTVFKHVKENVITLYADRDVPFNLYIALMDDALILTNDGNMFMNPIKNSKLKSEDLKYIMGHNFAFKIHSDKMLEGVRDSYFKGAEELPWFAKMMAELGNIQMHDNKPDKNGYTATAIFNLKDSSTNSLYILLKMMQAKNGF